MVDGLNAEESVPLLSIAIPAYGRRDELLFALKRFEEQIAHLPDGLVEVVVADDASPLEITEPIRTFTESFAYMHYHRYAENIGLEHNLLACTQFCKGTYCWIFGDDDFLETDDALEKIIQALQRGEYDFYVLNRTRRKTSHQMISANWMSVDPSENIPYLSLTDFCMRWGLISIIGFISVNIFKREPFTAVNAEPYLGTMYPQLGAMLEAFGKGSCLLLTEPLVCHRTQSVFEKQQGWGQKTAERSFFNGEISRNINYFGVRWIRLLVSLIDKGVFSLEQVALIPETTVIHGLLIEFLLDNIEFARWAGHAETVANWCLIDRFFSAVPLNKEQQFRWEGMV